MEAKLTMVSYLLMLCINWIFYLFYQELNKASQAAEREQEKLLKTKTTALQQVSNCNGVCLFEARASCTQLENEMNRTTKKHALELAELKEQLRVKQVSCGILCR